MTSFLPDDWTCRIARWITRWKPCVGWVSASECGASRGVCSLMKSVEHPAQLLEVDAAGLQHLGRRRVVEHREQQVLDGDELVLLLPGLDKSHVEGNFEFLRNHRVLPLAPVRRRRRIPADTGPAVNLNAQVSSIVHCNGCWCLRAMSTTCSTFAAATSRV